MSKSMNRCDIAIASEESLFGLPEVNFGHFPAGDTTVVLTEHLQPKHGLYYALMGKMMSKDAERIGLISKAVPRTELDKEVAEVAHDTRTPRAARVGAICPKETPAGVGSHELRQRIEVVEFVSEIF
jgi:enoyl-CoA hydratase/carnithine racemase